MNNAFRLHFWWDVLEALSEQAGRLKPIEKLCLELNIGMTKTEVIQVMGEPRKTEAYSMEGQNTEFWLYLTEGTIIGDGRMGDKNFTPLAFENGILIGWGRNFYDQALKYGNYSGHFPIA